MRVYDFAHLCGSTFVGGRIAPGNELGMRCAPCDRTAGTCGRNSSARGASAAVFAARRPPAGLARVGPQRCGRAARQRRDGLREITTRRWSTPPAPSTSSAASATATPSSRTCGRAPTVRARPRLRQGGDGGTVGALQGYSGYSGGTAGAPRGRSEGARVVLKGTTDYKGALRGTARVLRTGLGGTGRT